MLAAFIFPLGIQWSALDTEREPAPPNCDVIRATVTDCTSDRVVAHDEPRSIECDRAPALDSDHERRRHQVTTPLPAADGEVGASRIVGEPNGFTSPKALPAPFDISCSVRPRPRCQTDFDLEPHHDFAKFLDLDSDLSLGVIPDQHFDRPIESALDHNRDFDHDRCIGPVLDNDSDVTLAGGITCILAPLPTRNRTTYVSETAPTNELNHPKSILLEFHIETTT